MHYRIEFGGSIRVRKGVKIWEIAVNALILTGFAYISTLPKKLLMLFGERDLIMKCDEVVGVIIGHMFANLTLSRYPGYKRPLGWNYKFFKNKKTLAQN